MGKTSIEWTDESSNPLRYRDRATGRDAWACVKVSPGCANCYSEALAGRFHRGGPFTRQQMETVEPYLCEKELRRLLTSKALAGKRVFLGDMTDMFGEWVPDELLDRLFAGMALRPDVTFQVLTKRAGRMQLYLAGAYRSGAIQDTCRLAFDRMDYGVHKPMPWPLPNVWLGVSVEDQQRADERIPHLLATPATVRFLSCEPLLGSVRLTDMPCPSALMPWHFQHVDPLRGWYSDRPGKCGPGGSGPKLDWVIVGGESGPGARPCNVAWIRPIVRQCRETATACFVKQVGSNYADEQNGICGRLTVWPFDVLPSGPTKRLCDPKGGNPTEWPADLRVREFPEG